MRASGASDLVLGCARGDEGGPHEPRDAGGRGPGPEEDEALAAERLAKVAKPGQDPGHDHRRRPLDVVVEGGQHVHVAVQDPDRCVLLEVLPLEDRPRKDGLDAGDEGIDERVVGRPPQARVAPARVDRVGEKRLVVGPHVERDRQGERRVDPGAGGVDRQLAHRDSHPTRALVAKPEDPLVVRDDDQPDLLLRRVAEELRDAAVSPGVIHRPRGRRRMWLYSWQARPTVGV